MRMLRIRNLNGRGLLRMHELLSSFMDTPDRALDFEREVIPVLTSADHSDAVPNDVEIDVDATFARRFEMADYLHNVVPTLGLADPGRERGLWAWLALAWFRVLAPESGGARFIGEQARWLPDSGWKYYRHLVLGPYLIFAANQDHPQRAMAALHNPPHEPGEVVGQIAATQDIAQSKAAMGAATALYYDPSRGVIKRGAGGKGPGSSLRFRTVIDQLDRTFDLHSLTEERLLELLPREFDRFRRKAVTGSP
jgi:hypothetical protein